MNGGGITVENLLERVAEAALFTFASVLYNAHQANPPESLGGFIGRELMVGIGSCLVGAERTQRVKDLADRLFLDEVSHSMREASPRERVRRIGQYSFPQQNRFLELCNKEGFATPLSRQILADYHRTIRCDQISCALAIGALALGWIAKRVYF